jgi:hypothetical protein
LAPSKLAIQQLIKGCEMAMHSAALLAKRIMFHTEAMRKKQNRKRSRRQIKDSAYRKLRILSRQEMSEILRLDRWRAICWFHAFAFRTPTTCATKVF